MVQPISLRMLGAFELQAEGVPLSLPPSSERVIAYVALRPGRSSRSNVAGNLWSDAPDARAMGNLRSALWRLHRPGLRIIEADAEYLWLSPEVRVDVLDLAATAHRLMDDNRYDPIALEALASTHELLGDWYEEWVLVERERMRQLRLQALEQLVGLLTSQGRFGRAVEAALAAVSSEPLRESAHRALISVHLAQGNWNEAMHQYGQYREVIRDELGLDPSPLMDQLIRTVPGIRA